MAGSSGGALRTGEAGALSPRSPTLSTELTALMQRVDEYDRVARERDTLAAALAAAQSKIQDLEARTVQYPFLATQHAEAVAEVRQLKAAQLLLEEDARKNKPLRDAVVRELQVRLQGTGRAGGVGRLQLCRPSASEPWGEISRGLYVPCSQPRGVFHRKRGEGSKHTWKALGCSLRGRRGWVCAADRGNGTAPPARHNAPPACLPPPDASTCVCTASVVQHHRDALAASQETLAKERVRNAELEAALQQDGVALQQLRGELETTTRQLVHLTAEAAHARDTSAALAAAQAECVRLRGERAQLLEAESRRTGALAVGQEEANKQLESMAAELQSLRAKVAKNDVEHRQLCWSLASAENMAKGLTAQLAASETAREETERQLRAARSDAALAIEAQERVAKATAAVTNLVLSRGGSGQGPRSGEDGAHAGIHAAAAAAAAAAADCRAADSRVAEQLRASLDKALKEKAALQRALAASEQELRDFAEQVLVDSQTMHSERTALIRDRDAARQQLAQAQRSSGAAAASPAATGRSGGGQAGDALTDGAPLLPHVKVSTASERVAALEHALASAQEAHGTAT